MTQLSIFKGQRKADAAISGAVEPSGRVRVIYDEVNIKKKDFLVLFEQLQNYTKNLPDWL
jgi:hypothetical protein